MAFLIHFLGSRPIVNTLLWYDQTSKDLSLRAYRASPWIELASTHSTYEYQITSASFTITYDPEFIKYYKLSST